LPLVNSCNISREEAPVMSVTTVGCTGAQSAGRSPNGKE
jgi:hypothetical protein